MTAEPSTARAGGLRPSLAELQKTLAPFTRPSVPRSVGQLATSLLPYLALLTLMAVTVLIGLPYWITLLLVIPAVIFQVRTFIVFHDCCHGSFFKSRTANRIVGMITGTLTFTPYDGWGREHLAHHATVADLDRRGHGDVWTMTVREYKEASRWTRLGYWLVRHPLVMFGLGPIWVFGIFHRLPPKNANLTMLWHTLVANLLLAGFIVGMGLLIGWKAFLLIQLPVMYVGGMVGIWLFYVQHQFDPSHWAPHEDWDFLDAALDGSSYYKLPRVLQWMTGNIGLHHVHHANARIPNYRLQACLDRTPVLRDVPPLTLWKSLTSVRLNLWDETQKRLVSFGELRKGYV